MNTSLRGFGTYKRDLILEIFRLCGMRPFTYRDIRTLPSFKRKSFFSLVSGSYIDKQTRKNPASYCLNEPPVSHKKGTQSAEEWFIARESHAGTGAEG